MNLLSKLNSSAKTKTIEPREIFMTLPSKAPGYGYPRDVQSEVWKKWFDIRNEKNVILKMNTGSGKTVVGLIMLQSCLNEEKGPAIYVVPDNYLVKQVIDEAKRLGISATVDKDDYNYSNSKAILVTSIQTIVNGHSYFGMREAGNYPIGSIIIDDVHACMDKIIDQFMIKIDAETDAYKELIALFSSSLKDYNPKNYIDVVEMKDCRNNMLVPYWEWQRQQDNIYRILTKYNNSDNTSIYFGLPLIERCLETCDCIITASAIEISPKGIDLDKISSLEEASRRIYMSATLADDSVFVSALGLDTEDMKNIITPENANDMGDRLIIFPKYVNSDISEIEIKEKVEETAKKYNVVILVPSFSRAKFWDEQGMRTATKDNIDGIVKALKSGKHVGKIIFVNRYDGIDLPGDACRMLVIDGLPPLNSIKDRYIQSVAPQSTILLREQVQRIEQGINMQWLDAANAIKIVKDKENDKKTKGYLCQIQAEYINKIDSALSQEILKVGKNLSAAILSPLAGIQYQRTINTIPQAQAISTNLLAGKLGLNELLVYIDGVLSNLCIGSEYEKFEEALNQIGVVLGFVCSRPDKETGGYGPDNLWAIDSNKYLVIECKTEAITQTIKKDYCNQLSGSVNWFKENYVYPNECTPIIVHPSKFVDVVASPDENMRVMTEEELTCFRKNIRDFYSALCHNGSISDISKINELLSIYKLRKDDIVNRYTVKFERQK